MATSELKMADDDVGNPDDRTEDADGNEVPPAGIIILSGRWKGPDG